MDWPLAEYAKDAEETAAGLRLITSEIPQYRKEISALNAELYAITNALLELHDALALSRFGKFATLILEDLDVCIPSLGYTLDAVRAIFKKNGNAAPGAFPGTPPYSVMWIDGLKELEAQGVPLPVRLQLYREYLQEMIPALKGAEDEEIEIMDHIKGRLVKLLIKQTPKPKPRPKSKIKTIAEPDDSYFSRLSLGKGPSRTPKPPSPKMARPKIKTLPTYPMPNYGRPKTPVVPKLPHRGPAAPTWGGLGIGEIPFIPPAAPEIPQSPTYSSASSHTYSNGSSESEPVAHWGMRIFDGRHGATPFQTLGDSTVCFGRVEDRVLEFLERDGFERVTELPFEATSVVVRLYWRADDGRARILFLTVDPDGRRVRQCFPLTSLKIMRSDSCLQLCRVHPQDGRIDLWARLRFTLYERMVLFYCTAVAMKRQDEEMALQEEKGLGRFLEDVFQPGEKLEYSGEITDNRYLHALRIYRDKDSGCVRFEVTARRGPLKTIPIWTAFVTKYIDHHHWMKRVGSTSIQFGELHPYVFCEGYRVPKTPTGRYQLTFTTLEDARHFKETFHSIRVR
ncbi:hypothetical protein ACN47E_009774 [Coniothyrium glycines]